MRIKLSSGKVWNVSKFGENIACTISSGVTLMKELREYIKELATITVLPALTVGVFWAIWVWSWAVLG